MYLYDLPTTGFVSFADICVDRTNDKNCNSQISEATQIRANLRNALKESKRTDHQSKDYLQLLKVLDEYIPHIRGVLGCVAHDELAVKVEPMFSWRTTLSSSLLSSTSRPSFPGLHADWAFTLLVYGYTLSNYARTIVKGLGSYEHDRAISEADRKAKDDRLNFAVDLLRRASGIFTYIGETVLQDWEHSQQGALTESSRPLELTRDVNTALSKIALASAQSLAIRKLLTKSIYDSNVTPGPPLPKSHPSPALIAKLHLECAQLYSSARSLAKGASQGEVPSDLRRYLSDELLIHTALAHKWLGVEAGEKGGSDRGGDAVAFMIWAKKELEEVKSSRKLASIGSKSSEKDGSTNKKSRVAAELDSVEVFLKYYKKMNDSVHFRPVPPQSDLQARIPAGRAAVTPVAYVPPAPLFGPGSLSYVERQTESLELEESPQASQSTDSYAGSGSYY